jgi:hypothetical protein
MGIMGDQSFSALVATPTLTANLSGKVRRVVHNGREYLVAPLTLIVPGVLPGSKGALYYPLEEISRDPSQWNGVPLTVYHPIVNGRHVSAQSPDVLEAQGIGFVQKARVDGRLIAEGWFDVEKTKRVDNRVYSCLVSGRPIELSTGLYTENEPVPRGTSFNGRGYDYTARNYKADHVAILPDQVGACSLNDGCGVLVNVSGDGVSGEGGSVDAATSASSATTDSATHDGPLCPVCNTANLGKGNWSLPQRADHANNLSDKAAATSDKANKTDDPQDHASAKEAHEQAASAHRGAATEASAGSATKAERNYDAAGYHGNKAAYHASKAQEHADKCDPGSADKSGGPGMSTNGSKNAPSGTVGDPSPPELADFIRNAEDKGGDGFASDEQRRAFFGRLKEGETPSGKAAQASRAAHKKGTADNHEKAGKAHWAAMKAAKKDNKELAKGHEKAAAEHFKTAKELRGGNTANALGWHQVLSSLYKGGQVSRQEMIQWLTTNCDCWRAPGDQDTLNTFSDEKLWLLREGAERSQQAEAVANAARQGFHHGDTKYTYNAVTGSFDARKGGSKIQVGGKGTKDEYPSGTSTGASNVIEEEEEDPGEPNEDIPSTKKVKKMTENEWLATAPDGIQSAVRNAMEITQREKNALIGQLTANVADGSARKALTEMLGTKSLDELRSLMALVPQAPTPLPGTLPYGPVSNAQAGPYGQSTMQYPGTPFYSPAPAQQPPVYTGAATPPVAQATINRASGQDDDMLLLPTINYAEEAAAERRTAKGA